MFVRITLKIISKTISNLFDRVKIFKLTYVKIKLLFNI